MDYSRHTAIPEFTFYTPAMKEGCLALFNANCPEFFSPGEREDYAIFLDQEGDIYQLRLLENIPVAAFGMRLDPDSRHLRLNWIMIDPTHHGKGLGQHIMHHVIAHAHDTKMLIVDIAASHKSAPFFAKFGAQPVRFVEHGWGQDMHKVDMQIIL